MEPVLSESVFSYLVCSKCHKNYDETDSFFLTACTHSLCSTCIWPPPAIPPANPHAVEVDCPSCAFKGRIIKLDTQPNQLPEGIAYCFRPPRALLDELGIALEFQMGNLKEQIGWLKEKVVKQRAVLNKIKDELQRSREIKTRNMELEAENIDLKEQLAQLHLQVQSSRPDLNGIQSHDSIRYIDAQLQDVQDGSNKRRAVETRPAIIESRNRQTNAPLPPHRLSLSPNHAAQHSARQHEANLQRSESRTSSHHSRPNSRNAREIISEFRYNPNAYGTTSPRIPQLHSPVIRPATTDPNQSRQPHNYQNQPTPSFENPFNYSIPDYQGPLPPHYIPQYQYPHQGQEMRPPPLPPSRSNSNQRTHFVPASPAHPLPTRNPVPGSGINPMPMPPRRSGPPFNNSSNRSLPNRSLFPTQQLQQPGSARSNPFSSNNQNQFRPASTPVHQQPLIVPRFGGDGGSRSGFNNGSSGFVNAGSSMKR